MKSILQIYTLAMGPSSTLNTVPFLACRKVAHRIHERREKPHHVEIHLYNEYSRLCKEAGIEHDVRNAFIFHNFRYIVKKDCPTPAAVGANPYVFDIIVYKTENDVDYRHRVVATGGSTYYFTDERNESKLPFKNFEDIKTWFKMHPNATYFDFAKLGNNDEDIWSKFHRGMAFAESAVQKGFIRTGEVQTEVPNIHYTRRALSIWKHDETKISQAEDVNRVVSAYSYAMSETLVEKQTLVSAPTLCCSPVVWSIMLALKMEYNIPDSALLNAWCAAYIFAALVDCGASLAESEVGCQGPMGTACGMAAVIYAVVKWNADIIECGRAFEMALEHTLGLICDCASGLPIVPCIERCATYATRALDIAILNHSLMVTPELCKLDDVIKVLADTGNDLVIKNKRIGMGGFNEHSKYALEPAKDEKNVATKKSTKTKKATSKKK